MRGTSKKLLIMILILPLLGFSCAEQNLTDNIKEQAQVVRTRVTELIEQAGTNFIKNLSDAEKSAIEDWLLKNQLNQYGDPKDTIYTGGTPLFDEQGGQLENRYEYLFKKFPELKSIIKSAITE
ncbi:MAG: hypothetical protein Q8L21_00750 [Candidatus Komeilibacteria bacterium]|nr:hypothetical protein [Candidatus Komeilibacteria bacterium]